MCKAERARCSAESGVRQGNAGNGSTPALVCCVHVCGNVSTRGTGRETGARVRKGRGKRQGLVSNCVYVWGIRGAREGEGG